MIIRKITKEEITDALPMVWRVFNEYEAVNYPPSGEQAFFDAIHNEGFLSQLSAYGAFTFLADSDKQNITVNSSLYAVGIYEKLGFIKTAEAQTDSGIQFVPMVFDNTSVKHGAESE